MALLLQEDYEEYNFPLTDYQNLDELMEGIDNILPIDISLVKKCFTNILTAKEENK